MPASVYDYPFDDTWPPPVEGGPGAPTDAPPGDQPPPNTQPQPTAGGPFTYAEYGGSAPEALFNVLYPSGSTVTDKGLATKYLNSLGDPLKAKDYKTFFNTLYNGVTAKQEFLTNKNFAPILKAAGFNVTGPNAQGGISKIQTPDGQWVRVITGDPIAGGKWDWVPQTGTAGDLGAPFGEAFTPPQQGALPDMPQFHMPTLEDMLKDPGYQFRLGQGTQAMEQSAAARGVLNTGGTLKDLNNYGQSAASQEFGNVWGRNMDVYDRQLQGWQTLFGHGEHQNDVNYQRSYDKWVQDYNMYRNNQNDTFDRGYKLSQ